MISKECVLPFGAQLPKFYVRERDSWHTSPCKVFKELQRMAKNTTLIRSLQQALTMAQSAYSYGALRNAQNRESPRIESLLHAKLLRLAS